jgi:hypothetical protein
MLWGRSANRCSFQSCRTELVISATETDDESLIGDECHIVAKSTDGPRGGSTLTPDQRDKYENLILLCVLHHKLIDNQPNTYSVERLHQMKNDHENWVRNSLVSFDAARQRDDEQCAHLIQEFCNRVDIDNWRRWSSGVLSASGPYIRTELHAKLDETRTWILSRVWLQRYPEINNSLENFRRVLQDFLNVFSEHSESSGSDELRTTRFYKISEWNPTTYERLHREYEFHVDLVQDLMLELTRAANYVCDRVREELFPIFRLDEGVLLVTQGPFIDLSFLTFRCEYRGQERTDIPYPGLEAFKSARRNRDHHLGNGTQPESANELEVEESGE